MTFFALHICSNLKVEKLFKILEKIENFLFYYNMDKEYAQSDFCVIIFEVRTNGGIPKWILR